MDMYFSEEGPTVTERNHTLYINVCARITAAESKPDGQRPPPGKLAKLCYERSRLRNSLRNLLDER